MEFRILGPLELVRDGRSVPLAGARRRALLAILLLHAGEVVSRDRLLDDLSGGRASESGPTALRVHVSRLRRALGDDGALLVTRADGYALELEPDALDLSRFERLVAGGEAAMANGDAATAAERLGQALALWRGPPLGEFADAPFARPAILRLEELRLAAVEQRIDAELRLGRHAGLVVELRALLDEQPFREQLWAQLMLALYRAGRQADALATYREAHRRLTEEIGIEPGPALRELERRILAADQGLAPAAPQGSRRAVLAVAHAGAAIEPLAELAESLAASAGYEVIAAVLSRAPEELPAAAARLDVVRARAQERGVQVRVAAFTSSDHGADAVRLSAEQDVAIVLLDLPRSGTVDRDTAAVLAGAVCDVALVAGADRSGAQAPERPVLVPFAGHWHDWAAVELGAWLARAESRPLRLLGTRANRLAGRRDASRLLSHASLALQRGAGVAAEPALVAPGADAIVAAAADGAAIVAGLSDRWAREGVGATRLEIARRGPVPVLLIRRGIRPGGLAPPEALTHFTWSVLGP